MLLPAPAPGQTASYWDGDAGPKDNGFADGGDGTWRNAAGNDNWTDVAGASNAPFADGALAVFGGAPGTVTVDVSGNDFTTENDRLWGSIGFGGTYSWNNGSHAIYGDGLASTSLTDFTDSYAARATFGFRTVW